VGEIEKAFAAYMKIFEEHMPQEETWHYCIDVNYRLVKITPLLNLVLCCLGRGKWKVMQKV